MKNNLEKKYSQDEMNISEFPITALTKEQNFKPIICEDEITINGQKVKRKWVLSGDLTIGTPIAIDEELIMFIQKLLYETNYSTTELTYATYNFLKTAKWPMDKRSYLRHDLSLLRLFGCNIKAHYAIYDVEKKALIPITEAFHIIDDFKIYGKPRGIEQLDSHIHEFNFNKISVNKVFLKSAKMYSTKIDLDYYFSLDKPISKRLFRFLNKRFYNTDFLHFNIRELCKNHLGLIGEYNLAQLKRELDKAHEELTKKPYKNGQPFLKPVKDLKEFYDGEIVKYFKYVEEFPPLTLTQVLQNNEIRTDKDLVLYFHQRLGHKTYEISKSELKSARELIQKYGTKFTNYIVDYAIWQIKDKKAESSVRSFGYVISFVNEAIESYTKEQQEKKKEKEVEQEIKQREETDKEREKYLSKFRGLPQKQQEEIRNKAIEILIQQGVPKQYLFEGIIENQIIELIKQGVTK
jgi:gas vesicle protein